MQIKVSSPKTDLSVEDVDHIERDLEKIDRHLQNKEQVNAEVRITEANGGVPGYHVVLELDYGRNHLIATTNNSDMGRAVRAAREEILRQIKDRSRGGHSSIAKRR